MSANNSGKKISLFKFSLKKGGLLTCGLICSLLLFACVEEFNPEITKVNNLLVIEGSLIKGKYLQTINISYTSELADPEFKPVVGAFVTVADTNQSVAIFNDNGDGSYTKDIDDEFLQYNNKYQLKVVIGDTLYQSNWEELHYVSAIDSLYYKVEQDKASVNSYSEGLQFYADLKADESATKNYMWTVEETWEIHTIYSLGAILFPGNDDLSTENIGAYRANVCWGSKHINNSYVATTKNLIVNEKKMIPLNYVSETSSKLNEVYSIYVKQYSLTDSAFLYHKQISSIAKSDEIKLYQTQPTQSITNIRAGNNSGAKVLGYFWVSSVSNRRVFFKGPLNDPAYNCDLINCNELECLGYLKYGDRPVYFTVNLNPENTGGMWAYTKNQECIVCTAYGASSMKPSYWIY